MDVVGIWNSIGYVDGVLFTLWLGILYYGKVWIDTKFSKVACNCVSCNC